MGIILGYRDLGAAFGTVALVGAAAQYSYLPFDIHVDALGGFVGFDPSGVPAPGTGHLSLTQNSLAVGDPVQTVPLVGATVAEDLLLPGVTTGNIDDVGRIGFTYTGPLGAVYASLAYTPVDPANAGKHIHITGIRLGFDGGASPFFSGSIGTPQFAPLCYNVGADPRRGAGFFAARQELAWTSTGPNSGVSAAAHAFPAGTFSDLLFVSDDPAGVSGSFRFGIRQNGVTVLSLTTTGGAQRLWSAGVATADIFAGDRVCFIGEVLSGGPQADGFLLCAFRRSAGGGGGYGADYGADYGGP